MEILLQSSSIGLLDQLRTFFFLPDFLLGKLTNALVSKTLIIYRAVWSFILEFMYLKMGVHLKISFVEHIIQLRNINNLALE